MEDIRRFLVHGKDGQENKQSEQLKTPVRRFLPPASNVFDAPPIAGSQQIIPSSKHTPIFGLPYKATANGHLMVKGIGRLRIPQYFDALPIASQMKKSIKKEEEPSLLMQSMEELLEIKRVNDQKLKALRGYADMSRRLIPQIHRKAVIGRLQRKSILKQLANDCMHEVRHKAIRIHRRQRELPQKTRRLARDMLAHLRRIEKEKQERERRRKKEQEEALRREEQRREEKAKAAKMNFLLTQSEIFAHFVSKKMGMDEQEKGLAAEGITGESSAPQVVHEADEDGDFVETEESLRARATHRAGVALNKQAEAVRQSDVVFHEKRSAALAEVASMEAAENGEESKSADNGSQSDFSGIARDFASTSMLTPSTMPERSNFISQPKILTGGVLKEYQISGLNWLANLYEQGINGILADEMGLGKTLMCISLLAHLANAKNIWGPFLVIAPKSTLHNWQEELLKFCPSLRVLPYWGTEDDRKVIRSYWVDPRLFTEKAPFHICVTSYQMAVNDAKQFQRVKWQYMVLDEAQAIKSYRSKRWKTLLQFKCRARLLMTGTPIQNSMAELWALLHFIMPTLFDSHKEFSDWFAKDIEQHAEGQSEINHHQLSRLHVVLKPFMLRRVKKDVENEMPSKTEIEIKCGMTPRQKNLYDAIKSRVTLEELTHSNLTDSDVSNLMNVIMQLRKACLHPDLFEEQRYVKSPFVFSERSVVPVGSWERGRVRFSNTLDGLEYIIAESASPITIQLPRLLVNDPPMACGYDGLGTLDIPMSYGYREKFLDHIASVYNTHRIAHLLDENSSDTFSFVRLLGLSPAEFVFLSRAPFLLRSYLSYKLLQQHVDSNIHTTTPSFSLRIPLVSDRAMWGHFGGVLSKLLNMKVQPLEDAKRRLAALGGVVARVLASHPQLHCPGHASFSNRQIDIKSEAWSRRVLFGAFYTSTRSVSPPAPVIPSSFILHEWSPYLGLEDHVSLSEQALVGGVCSTAPGFLGRDRYLASGAFSHPDSLGGLGSILFTPAAVDTLIHDSGKMKVMDSIMCRLMGENVQNSNTKSQNEIKAKREGQTKWKTNKVLVYTQMTKVLDLLEAYLNYRCYKFVRLDGSTEVSDRRDRVHQFQNNPDTCIFILSTRAGGLGINLVAANTVIFYDSDWNPTMDAQAMDRAHRLGQTRDVTVYRLVANGTVEERILARAKEKNMIQQVVIMGGKFNPDQFKSSEVVSLLIDDAEVEKTVREQQAERARERRRKRDKIYRKRNREEKNEEEGGKKEKKRRKKAKLGDGDSLAEKNPEAPPKKKKRKKKVVKFDSSADKEVGGGVDGGGVDSIDGGVVDSVDGGGVDSVGEVNGSVLDSVGQSEGNMQDLIEID